MSNDFRNVDGTTRIAYIFDLSDDSGAAAPGNPYGRGTIYTGEQINQALFSGTGPSSRLLKNSAKWDRQIDPVVLRCSQH